MSEAQLPSIQIYNTLTHTKELFVPRDPGKVGIYACGLTPQGPAHLGHMRGAVAFDAIRRWLSHVGYDVRMVQNFTDIDDKIIRKSHEEGLPAAQIAARYGAQYLDDWNSLGIAPVQFVKVTENIDAIVALVEELVNRGHAYAADSGDVYFAVGSIKGYGKLSRRSVEEMEAGARIEVSAEKRGPMDFSLWKAAKPGEPSWPSPWGQGRPGWHIECSALALKFLGNSFDIHAGGIDLIFPHHENEIAQSEAATGVQPFARYWTHWGPVNSDGTKMSKSLGNYFAVKEVLAEYPSDVVRLYLLSTHYRSPIDYAPERLADSKRSYERIRTALDVAEQTVTASAQPDESFAARFSDAMNDDFNTAQAIGVVFETIGELNRELAASAPVADRIASLTSTVRLLLPILGFDLPAMGLSDERGSELTEALVERAISWRQAARAAQQFALSDQIRDDLKMLGIVLEDRAQGTTWRRE
jgi:cysteinyl-tRNA synthetase